MFISVRSQVGIALFERSKMLFENMARALISMPPEMVLLFFTWLSKEATKIS